MTATRWFAILTLALAFPAAAQSNDETYSAGVHDTITGETYAPAATDDTDHDGIPDNPFVTLPSVGEVWLATIRNEHANTVKTVIAERWNGATQNNAPSFLLDVEVQRAGDVAQPIVLEIPYTLALPGEAAVVLVSIASDLEALLGSTEAGYITALPDGTVVPGGQFIEISVIVSDDAGLTYTELDDSRLNGNPIRLMMGGLTLDAAGTHAFYKHPSNVHSDDTTGLSFLAEEGEWEAMNTTTVLPEHSRNTQMATSIEATLTSLSIFLPFASVASTEDSFTGDSEAVGSNNTTATGTSVPSTNSDTTETDTTSMSSAYATGDSKTRANRSAVVWVDFDYLGPEDGSETQPFNLFAEGIAAVTVGGTINLKPAVSDETFTVSTAMTITAVGGTARIGDLSALRDVTINEFVPTNLNGLQDEDIATQDWIELFNASAAPVSLNGWGLSNDTADPFKWTFPNVSIPAGDYLVVFASGKNRTPTDGSNLHTNYTLAASADDMVLTTPGPGSISPTNLNSYPAISDDNASAFFPQGSGGGFQETNNPTPGAQNQVSSPTVILDPGHGLVAAGDSATTGLSNVGATGFSTFTEEWRGAWTVAQQVKTKINTLDPSINVIISKPTETGNISNLERARQLGDNNAELLVSIHFDGNDIGTRPRRTFAIALPELFQETIGGVLFRTDNRNQADEVVFGQKLVDAVVAAFLIPGVLPSQNSGVRITGTDANKGVLFETTSGWSSNPPWEERLYHTNPNTPTGNRGIAVILEIDNYKNGDVDLWLNDEVTSRPIASRHQPISDAIAQVIVDELTN